MAKKAISEKALTVLNYLKENQGVNMTAADIADALGMQANQVNPIVTSGLIGTKEPKKNLAVRVDAEIELQDGTHKAVKFIKVTDAGLAYDHDAAIAADIAAAQAKSE